jgi:hypothetical protein
MREIVYEELKVGDEVVTRDGRKGRVLCVDLNDIQNFVIACALTNHKGTHEHINLYRESGRFSDDINSELDSDIFLPPKKEKVDIYRLTDGSYLALKHGSIKELVGVDFIWMETIEVEI